MTLEQKILEALAEGDRDVSDALLLGVFGRDAQMWWALEIIAYHDAKQATEGEPKSLPDCFDTDPPWVKQ